MILSMQGAATVCRYLIPVLFEVGPTREVESRYESHFVFHSAGPSSTRRCYAMDWNVPQGGSHRTALTPGQDGITGLLVT